ncbi:MAG TPA: DUF1259 domain-containing protein [Terriglobales bacterium]|nr:DUF1259 domain-containing protein [Terriglobales bacterium]
MLRTLGLALCLLALLAAPHGRAQSLDAAAIHHAMGRPGAWVEGVYLITLPRPDLSVSVAGLRLAPGQLDSLVTFTGWRGKATVMGDLCLRLNEITAVIARLRAQGLDITGVHNHFLNERPRLMFVHFSGHGTETALAHAVMDAYAATATPAFLRDGPRPASPTAPAPAWVAPVERALGRKGDWGEGLLDIDIAHADQPALPDYWKSSALLFQSAGAGQVAATGDLAVTAAEVNPVLSALTAYGFEILALHNHMLRERPRLFFIHFWKVGPPPVLCAGLQAALAAVHSRLP